MQSHRKNKPLKPMPRFGWRCGIRRFGRNQDGATAVEFGLVALPFVALVFAILEVAIVFFAGQALETSVSYAARLVRTGQAQQQGFNEGQFKDQVCKILSALFDCANGLKLDVRTYKTFDQIDMSKPVDKDGNLNTNFTYNPGKGGDIVVVRAYYEWPVVINLLGFSLANMPNGTYLLGASAAFRNEPFPW